MNMFDKAHARVQCDGRQSEPIDSVYGVLQGGILSPKLFNEYLSDLPNYLDKNDGIKIENLEITHMLYADDIVLISDSQTGLQKHLNALHTFCSKWHLIVNISKTKVLNFTAKNDTIFKYNNTELEIVENYKYLGHVISNNKRDFHKDMFEYLTTQANKALFALKVDTKQNLGHIPPKLAMQMFDTYIMPILDYNSIIWSKPTPTPEIEAIQITFLKIILGIRKQTPTPAVYAETGRFPLNIRHKNNVVKYWARLETMPDCSILNKCLNIQKQLHYANKSSWYSKVDTILKQCNIELTTDNELDNKYYEITTKIKLNSYQNEIEHILAKVNDNGSYPKLRTYKLFKTDYRTETYLAMNLNIKSIRSIARFRTSSHNLKVETGRHDRPITPLENRICEKCNNDEVEDEIHYLLICPAHENSRAILLAMVTTHLENFSNLNMIDQFKLIMMSKNEEIIRALGQYLTFTMP